MAIGANELATDRRVREVVARCVSAMVYYHNTGRSGEASERMALEVQLVAAYILEDLRLGEVEVRVIRPLEFELIERYGHEVGPRLLGEFLASFDCLARSVGRSRKGPAPKPAPGSGRRRAGEAFAK